ncbi:uncharacterized protein LOC128215470 [Mya arenaria]|uniref:uncharacterized protein LOC128215470 n=1 Tax=Mya arenaria TaxID=6604 RepID=UPI0022E7E861|nr:uncharacterized protein LOC128215470 [Mya arenaria]
MATGGSSFYKGSDLIHDYSCTKCEEDNFNTEAQHFCSQCEHYLCDKCVNLHNGYNTKHTVYGRGNIQKWAKFSLDRCDQHGNKLEIHCDDHQELCCSVCVVLNHRLCSSIRHLPDLAKGFMETAEFKQLPAAADEMRNKLDDLKDARMKDQASLKDSIKSIIAEINALRKEVNNILDQLEKKTVEQLDRLMNDLQKSVKDDLDICADMHDRLKIMIDKLQQVTRKNKETNSYIGFKKCLTKLNEAKSLVHKIERRPKEGIWFKSDESVLQFLRNLNGIGCIESVHSMPKRPKTVHVYKVDESILSMPVARNHSIKISEGTCHIVGICALPSGNLVIADQNNQRVKLLNKQFKVVDQFDLPYPPQHLCHIAGEEIAVAIACGDIGGVYFLTVIREQLMEGRNCIKYCECYSIAHHQGQLYLGSYYAIDHYTIDGQFIKQIYLDQYCSLEGSSSAVSPDGERIYFILKETHTLLTLDKDGQVLSIFAHVIQDLSGLFVSPSGHVFLCGEQSQTVVQVDREGRKKLATVVRENNGLIKPLSLCFCEQNSNLIVGNSDSDNITVVKLC